MHMAVCKMWGTLLLSITLLSFGLDTDLLDENIQPCTSDYNLLQDCIHGNYSMECRETRCKQDCNNGAKVCEMFLNCSKEECKQTCDARKCGLECSGKWCRKQHCNREVQECEMVVNCCEGECEQTCYATKCGLECSGEWCRKQHCNHQVQVCEMVLNCSGGECEQICNAEKCGLECNGEWCKKQHCNHKTQECEMVLNCRGGECEQICNAEKCGLECNGEWCKKQHCNHQVQECEMVLNCSGGDCEQICNAEKCGLECNGEWCKKQHCNHQVQECEMVLNCSGGDCEQICNAEKCGLECNGEWCKKQYCKHQVQVCEMVLNCSGGDCEQICNAEKCQLECNGEGCKKQHCNNQVQECNLLCNASNCIQKCDASTCRVTKIWPINSQHNLMCSGNGPCGTSDSRASQVLATQISIRQQTGKSQANSPLLLSSPLPLFLPSPSPSPSASPSTSTTAATVQSALADSSSKSVSALALAKATTSFSLSLSPATAASSPLFSQVSTSPSSTLEVLKNLENYSISKLGGIDIRGNSSLKEAVRIFEDFTAHLLNITKSHTGHLSKKEDETRRESIFAVAFAFEEFALNYGKQHLSGTKPSTKITSQKMVLGIQIGYRQNMTDFFFTEAEWKSSINISPENFAENGSVIVGCVYKDLHELLLKNISIAGETDSSRSVNTMIMTAAMNPRPAKLRQDVTLKFSNLEVVHADEEKHCMFWSGFKNSAGGFSEEGCRVDSSKSDSKETVCHCNHLTHFAVLVDFSGSTELSTKDRTILEIITCIGLSLSIMGMLWTISLYSFLTDVRQPLSQIRLSLAVALGAGQIIFLIGINATENKAACVTVAALMQYFLMAAFCWMLVEGIYLYLFVVKVYNINTTMHIYHIMSWGLPLVMVAISLCIAAGKEGIQSYTSDKFCWMSSANNLIWIFVTFVITIELINLVILVRVIKEMTSMQPTGDKQSQQIRISIKACVVMIPLLGITWLFGLLSPLHIAFSYIFNILNSTQGFLIFALHCLRNSQIRERFKRKVNTIFPSSNSGNSTKTSSQINPSDVGDMWVAELQSCNEFELSEKPST
ncbi:adhesion G-protein coupled receptor D1-like isoform X1 [Stylophora pistillata]|uniref:adhesion G-protein coupled receptor D1-like isoform X1 n=1 Tax=Stylophora pistillata TaxID=50429 RepID=UPI000C04EF44|nr:adhesion G-protein coupled receptor D1-like isoform X1 [Stylophora pistillata]